MSKKTKQSAPLKLTVPLVKSPIGYARGQAAVVRGLGLRRLGHSVKLPDTPAIRGMIHKVRHLVRLDEATR